MIDIIDHIEQCLDEERHHFDHRSNELAARHDAFDCVYAGLDLLVKTNK